MSMVSLTIAPLLRDNEDWYKSYLGVIPLALFIICSAVLVVKGILTWKDPLGDLGDSDAKTPEEEVCNILYVGRRANYNHLTQ